MISCHEKICNSLSYEYCVFLHIYIKIELFQSADNRIGSFEKKFRLFRISEIIASQCSFPVFTSYKREDLLFTIPIYVIKQFCII